MEFYVNKNKIDITLENEKTIGDVLRSFEETCAENKATTVSIFVNGVPVNAENFDDYAKLPLTENTKLELETITETEITAAFFQNAEKCREIAQKLEQVPVQLQSNNDREANAIITELADLVSDICHVATFSALFPTKFGALTINDKNLLDFFSDFSAILTDFEHALEDKDSVLTGDLAEYEISPRLIAFADAMEALK